MKPLEDKDPTPRDPAEAPIFVTRPYLPSLDKFIPYLEEIWSSRVLTNCGPFHQQLERELCDRFGLAQISLFANATIALVTALQALRIGGEVITTPYSFVATSHSLLWNGIKPVFVDIHPDSLNIDPARIEAAITPHTTAIMAVHCYGNPCDTEAIQRIADNYNLKVIYDAAHALGVEDENGSILQNGDLSVLSFHATKVFNTFEGGAIVSPNAKTKGRIDQLKNFGHAGETSVVAVGINGKMSEFNAALGLLQLKSFDEAVELRRKVDTAYRAGLRGIKGIRCLSESPRARVSNYSYFAILVGSDYTITRDELYERLKSRGIHSRRYFYPLISDFPMYRGLPSARAEDLPVARAAAQQVLCLPIYPDLDLAVVDEITRFIVAPDA